MADEEAIDRESFIKRLWRDGYTGRRPVSELLNAVRETEAEQIADSLQAWIDLWEEL